MESRFCVGYIVGHIDEKFCQPTLLGELKRLSKKVCFEPPSISNTLLDVCNLKNHSSV